MSFSPNIPQVGALSFGAAPIGNLYRAITDQQAEQAIRRALALDIHLFDTAPYYGFGLSEERVGRSLHGSTAMISTKVGRLLDPIHNADPTAVRHGFHSDKSFEPRFDYSYRGVMASFEASLGRLKRDRVDILLAHDLGQKTHGADHPRYFKDFIEGGYRAMRELRDAGRVKSIGLGVNEVEVCLQAMNHADFDCFLLAGRYTLIEQGAGREFFPRCRKKNIGVIAAGPFNSGILVEKEGSQYHYNYERAPDDVVRSRQQLAQICAQFGIPLAAAALQFVAAHPAVTTVLAGFAHSDEVSAAVEMMKVSIPTEFWRELHQRELLEEYSFLPGEI